MRKTKVESATAKRERALLREVEDLTQEVKDLERALRSERELNGKIVAQAVKGEQTRVQRAAERTRFSRSLMSIAQQLLNDEE